MGKKDIFIDSALFAGNQKSKEAEAGLFASKMLAAKPTGRRPHTKAPRPRKQSAAVVPNA